MQATQRMYEVMLRHNPAARNLVAGLREALKDVPDVQPFVHSGYPDNPVFIHPSCGTVIDADPAMRGIEGSVWSDIAAGECDCENTAPWLRIYVEKQEKA